MNKCEINEDLGGELFKSFWCVYNINTLKLKENSLKFSGIMNLAESLKLNKILRKNLRIIDIGNTRAKEEETVQLA